MLLINVKKIQKKKIENRIDLSRQLIRKWEKRFKEHETRLKVTFNNELKEIFNQMLDDKFIIKYYKENNIYYFQKVPT